MQAESLEMCDELIYSAETEVLITKSDDAKKNCE